MLAAPVSQPCLGLMVELQVWTLSDCRHPYLGRCFIPGSSSPSGYPVTVSMVRRRGSCRRRGGRRGRGCSQPAPPSVIPLASASPTSKTSRPLPYNSFQTTHFTFHSRLNQPVLSASITVIFSEEEARPTTDTNTPSTDSPAGGAQQRIDVGFDFHGGNSQVERTEGNISMPPASTQQNAPTSEQPTDGLDSSR